MSRAFISSQTPEPRISGPMAIGVACRRTEASSLGSAVAIRASAISGGQGFLQVLVDGIEEAKRREPLLVGPDEQAQVLGHLAFLDGRDGDLLERVGELAELDVVVE